MLLYIPSRWGALLLAMTLPLLNSSVQAADAKSLAERLGYGASDKLLIVNGDDAGMCHSANLAVVESMEKGLLQTATVMVPCPWFPEIAAYAKANPARDFGVHLCHTSEWGKYRWGPVVSRDKVPGLIDPQGYLWGSIEEVYAHATPQDQAGMDIITFPADQGRVQ